MVIEHKTNKVPSSIVHSSMIDAKNRQLGYQSPVKKLFQKIKFTGSVVHNSEAVHESKKLKLPFGKIDSSR
jgi:hypothetical protein